MSSVNWVTNQNFSKAFASIKCVFFLLSCPYLDNDCAQTHTNTFKSVCLFVFACACVFSLLIKSLLIW